MRLRTLLAAVLCGGLTLSAVSFFAVSWWATARITEATLAARLDGERMRFEANVMAETKRGRSLASFTANLEPVVRAFAAGDRETLRNLLAPNVLTSFEGAIEERETQGRSESVEFLHPPRADIERADLHGDMARITVRFLAEFRSRTKGPEGEAVDDKRTAELWTFERSLKSRDPNWILVHVDAAEA